MNDTKKILLAAAAGLIIGAVAGVLLAPEKGVNIRKKIIDQGKNLADAVKEKFNKLDGKYKDIKETLS